MQERESESEGKIESSPLSKQNGGGKCTKQTEKCIDLIRDVRKAYLSVSMPICLVRAIPTLNPSIQSVTHGLLSESSMVTAKAANRGQPTASSMGRVSSDCTAV